MLAHINEAILSLRVLVLFTVSKLKALVLIFALCVYIGYGRAKTLELHRLIRKVYFFYHFINVVESLEITKFLKQRRSLLHIKNFE